MEDSTIGKGNKRKKEVRYFKCPGCHIIITYEGKPGQKIKVECPNCRKKSMIDFDLQKPEKILPLTKNKSEDKNLSSEKNQILAYEALVEKTRSQFSEKITLSKIIWIIFSSFITVVVVFLFFVAATGKIYIDTLYVSIFIGIAVLKELTDKFTPNRLKKKINIIVSGFIIVFLFIVVNEIIGLISK